jgi:hypothetical protein
LRHAARLAAALGYLVVREGDEVALSLTDEKLRDHLPPGSSWSQLNRILDLLGRAEPSGTTGLGECLDEVFARIKRRGVLVVLSDFLELSPAFWKSIDLFRRSRFDVMLFQVAHPEELDLPAVAAARFVEAEGGHGKIQRRAGRRARAVSHALRRLPFRDESQLPGPRLRLVPGAHLGRSLRVSAELFPGKREWEMKDPRSKIQDPEKLQDPNFKNDSAGRPGLVLGAWSFSGSWILDLGSFSSSA